ncbi:MAG: exo-alpha-sialidase [Armatimonadetes bacterium]|nr:exo-alpha-sialidase [Armatimonadota bacterium]
MWLAALSMLAPPLPAHYALPILDLAFETERQVVVDREANQYLGHVSTLLLPDGKTILAVYPKGHGKGAIIYRRSTDGGLTWSPRLGVPENWATSLETPTIYRLIGPDGKARIVLFSGLQPIRSAVSEDDGLTWSPLRPAGTWGGIVAMGDVQRLADGTYAAWFHDDGRFFEPKPQPVERIKVYQSLSHDGGLTWAAPTLLFQHETADLCEPGVVRSPDGRRLAMLLRENTRRQNGFISFSDDEARTWSTPRPMPAALTGDRHTLRYAPDGRLVAVFRDMALQSVTWGDFVAWVGTFDDLVAGREGQYRVRLGDNKEGADCGYPGLEVLPDGTFVATTYGHWTAGQPPYIVSFRFTLAELDARLARAQP